VNPSTVAAVLFLSLLVTAGVVKIVETYAYAASTLTTLSEVAQKPTFTIIDVFERGTDIVLLIENRGPEDVYVDRILLYRYNEDGTPRDYIEYPIRENIQVAEIIELAIPKDEVKYVTSRLKPVLLTIVTEKGPLTISYTPPPSTLIVNILVPEYLRSDPQAFNDLTLHIDCSEAGGPVYPINFTDPPQTPNVVLADSEAGFTVIARVWGLGTCTGTLTGKINIYHVGSTKLPTSEGESEDAWITLKNYDVNDVFYVSVGKGGTASVELAIPDVAATWVPTGGFEQYVLDFSWYFTAWYPPDTLQYYDVLFLDPYYTWYELIKTGLVAVESPAGCPVYPAVKNPPPTVLEYYREDALVVERADDQLYHTGMPVMVQGYPCSESASPVALRVDVPLRVPQWNRAVVVPVFTYHDVDGQNNFKAIINVTVLSGNDTLSLLNNITIPEAESGGWAAGDKNVVQFAAPMVFEATGNKTVLRIEVVDSDALNGTGRGSADRIEVKLSKILVYPAGESSACNFEAPPATWPFAIVDLETGNVTPLATVYAMLAPNESDSLATGFGTAVTLYSSGIGAKTAVADETGIRVGDKVYGYLYELPVRFDGSSIIITPLPGENAEWSKVYLYGDVGGVTQRLEGGVYVAKYPDEDIEVAISFLIPEPGTYYAIIPYAVDAGAVDWIPAPHVKVSGTVSFEVLAPTTSATIDGETAYLLREAYGFPVHGTVIVKVDADRAGYLTLTFDPGQPYSVDQVPVDAELYIYAFYLVRDPGLPLPEPPLGIVLDAPSASGTASATLLDVDGDVVASWTLTVEPGTAALLSVDALAGTRISTGEYTQFYRVYDTAGYLLTLMGATCPQPEGSVGDNLNWTQPTPVWFKTPINITAIHPFNDAEILITIPSDWDGWELGADPNSVYFTTSGGTPLYFYIAEWDAQTRTAKIWVRFSAPVAGTHTIYMFWSPSEPNPYPTYHDARQVFHYYNTFDVAEDFDFQDFGLGDVMWSSDMQALLKDTNPHPNGGIVALYRPAYAGDGYLGIVLEYKVYRPTANTNSLADRVGLAEDLGDGRLRVIGAYVSHTDYWYYRTFGVEENILSYTGTRLSTTQLSRAYLPLTYLDTWLTVRVYYYWDDSSITAYLYDSSGNLIRSTTIVTDVPSIFHYLLVMGGYPYYVDDIIVRVLVDASVTVADTSETV